MISARRSASGEPKTISRISSPSVRLLRPIGRPSPRHPCVSAASPFSQQTVTCSSPLPTALYACFLVTHACAAATLSDASPANGTILSQTIKNRRYCDFQVPTEAERAQRYVGAKTPELLERIAHRNEARDDERECGALVSPLIPTFGITRPI